MPIYVYKCPVCERTREFLMSLNDPPPRCLHRALDETPNYIVMEKQATAPSPPRSTPRDTTKDYVPFKR